LLGAKGWWVAYCGPQNPASLIERYGTREVLDDWQQTLSITDDMNSHCFMEEILARTDDPNAPAAMRGF
jgi:hypothetical protein